MPIQIEWIRSFAKPFKSVLFSTIESVLSELNFHCHYRGYSEEIRKQWHRIHSASKSCQIVAFSFNVFHEWSLLDNISHTLTCSNSSFWLTVLSEIQEITEKWTEVQSQMMHDGLMWMKECNILKANCQWSRRKAEERRGLSSPLRASSVSNTARPINLM